MDKMKRIMAAVGFSEYAEGLISFAARFAEDLAAELIVVNIINLRDVEAVGTIAAMGYDVDSEHYVTGIREERQQMLNRILKKISYPPEKARCIIKIGHPVEELLRIAVEENADLMVMGIKGRTDLSQVLVGSVAEKVFRRSPVPILSYRDEKNAERLRKQIDHK